MELVTTNQNTVAAPSVDQLQNILNTASIFVKSGLFSDTRDVNQAVVKIMAGQELGMGPFESMRDVNIIQGKTTLAAAQVSARIKRSGKYDFEILQFDDQAAKLRFTKHGKPLTPDISFTIEDAKLLGLAGKDNYKKQARTMLFWRAVTMGARMYCPDVFGGPIYTPDEIAKEGSYPLPAVDATSPAHSLPDVELDESYAAQMQMKLPGIEAEPNPWLYVVRRKNKSILLYQYYEKDPGWFRNAYSRWQHARNEEESRRYEEEYSNIKAALENMDLLEEAKREIEQEEAEGKTYMEAIRG